MHRRYRELLTPILGSFVNASAEAEPEVIGENPDPDLCVSESLVTSFSMKAGERFVPLSQQTRLSLDLAKEIVLALDQSRAVTAGLT